MVATAARKARREAAALAAAGGAPAAAAPSPAAATPAARALTTSATKSAAISSSSSLAPRKTIVKGTGSKSQGTYTPPAILRAVANAARNKESKGGGNGGGGDRTGGAAAAKADWDCASCGKSNFAKRRACFKCDAPRPGRTFTAAGVKGWEKRQAKRAAKQQAAGGGGGGETRDDDDDAAAAAARDARPKKPKKTKLSDDGDEDEDEDKRRNARPKRKSVKASDRGKAPKKLRDPTAPLVYLEAWMGRGELDASTGKPANGWKLDKNIQNWLLHNVFDEGEVDDDVFDITVMYAGGLRGGPATRLRDAAREKNFGKGVVAERARKILRALEKSASEMAE